MASSSTPSHPLGSNIPSAPSAPPPPCIRGRLPVDMGVVYGDASLLGSTFEAYEGFGSFFNEDVEVLIAKSKEDYRAPEGLPVFANLDFYLSYLRGGGGGEACPLGTGDPNILKSQSSLAGACDGRAAGSVTTEAEIGTPFVQTSGGANSAVSHFTSVNAEEGSQPASPQTDLSANTHTSMFCPSRMSSIKPSASGSEASIPTAGGVSADTLSNVVAHPVNRQQVPPQASFTSIDTILQRRCTYQDKRGTFFSAPCDPMWIREMRQLKCIPPFGPEFKNVFFSMGSEFTFVNHGAFGGALKIGTDIKRRYEDLAECQLLKYMDRLALPAIAHSTRIIAERILRCDPKDVVITQNATYALNVAVSSLIKAPPLPRASVDQLSQLLTPSPTVPGATVQQEGSDEDDVFTSETSPTTEQLRTVMPQLSSGETVVAYLDTEYLSVFKMVRERLDLMQADEAKTRQAIDEVLFLARADQKRRRQQTSGGQDEDEASAASAAVGVVDGSVSSLLPPPLYDNGKADSGISLHEIPLSKFFRRTNLMGDDAALTRHLLHNIPRNTTTLVLDHVTSNSAMRLPVFSHIIPALRRRSGFTKYSPDDSIRSHFLHGCETERSEEEEEPLYFPRLEHIIVDGAHSPLQCHDDMDMGNMPIISQPSVYCGNFHKWFSAPKSAGFLWVRKDVRPLIRPLIVSHGAGSGFLSDFIWDGTKDLGAILSLPALVEFWYDVVGIDRVQAYCNNLRTEAVKMLTAAFGSTEVPRHSGFMSLVELPPFFSRLSAKITAKYLQEALHATYCIEAPIKNIEGVLYVRCSFFVNNGMSDYEKLRDAILAIQTNIQETMVRNFREKYCDSNNGGSNNKTPNVLPRPTSTATCYDDDAESHTGSKRERSGSPVGGSYSDTDDPTSSQQYNNTNYLLNTPPTRFMGGTSLDSNGGPPSGDQNFNSFGVADSTATEPSALLAGSTSNNSNQRRKKIRSEEHHLQGSGTNNNSFSGGGGVGAVVLKRGSNGSWSTTPKQAPPPPIGHPDDIRRGTTTTVTRQHHNIPPSLQESQSKCTQHLPELSNNSVSFSKEASRAQNVIMPRIAPARGLVLEAPHPQQQEREGMYHSSVPPYRMADVLRVWAESEYSQGGGGSGTTTTTTGSQKRSSESPGAAAAEVAASSVSSSSTPTAEGGSGGASSATVKPNCNGCAVSSLGGAARKTRKF